MVFLDEPTAGLDPLGREEMLALVRRTGSEFGISILLSSHLMGDVESTCDRIVVLDGGKVVEDGTVSQLTRETETLYVDVDDHRDELLTSLQGKGLEAEVDGISIVIENVAGDSYDVVRDSLAESGARLRRMAPRRHRLTDIFRR
jgi:ABC-2 type transport system ATP-binding protein